MIPIKEKKLKNMTFIDLFAGIGGFRLAFESFGAKCVFSSEIDKKAIETYYNNFGEVPSGDITKIDETEVPDHDILCGGFPCQAFSISGKRMGFEDARGTLFFDVARIIKFKRPKIVLLENVKNLKTHDKGRTISVIENTLKDLGYSVFSQVLSASDFNIPQKRERIYIVAFRSDLQIHTFNFPVPLEQNKVIKDILLNEKEIVTSMYYQKTWKKIESKNKDTPRKPKKIGFVGNGGQGERIYSTENVGVTLSANGGGVFSKTGGYLINEKVRKLHPRECARMMGFPDSFFINNSASQAYKQFGNSVVVDVLQHIITEIVKKLKI
ncbi:DNA cytosine methyltransferase [Mycoplasma sp. Ms02]|uniref:DNA cytosine methyltransferase n=1 Tax=Mycoplasma sp. Ms02 TaxID=353851 RepID=UPI001C8A57E1|nr:DNA cytosine methyltransferase [Mycoplasma sp. Ms02]QZE12536.1 DNA cytosine methyltransferase [Mycoplasma sp. Ms02]